MGRKLWSSAILGAAMASLAATGALAQNRGGAATVGVEQDIAGFDVLVVGVYDTGQIATAALLFDTLTRIDDSGKVIPRLALSWTASEDLKTWVFKLRPGVTFHDGTPFNAQAVAYNYERMLDPKNRCRCAIYISYIDKVVAQDDLTVVFNLKTPSPGLPSLLAPSFMVNVVHSPKAMQEAAQGVYNRNPVGTGAFKLKSWASGDRLVLERNPNYWDKPKPYLDQVTIRPLPDGPARFASILSGETDIIWHDNADDLVKAKKNKNVVVNAYVGAGAGMVAINTKKAPLDDIRVRQAIRHAADMQAVADTLYNGLWKPANHPYGPDSWVKCGKDVKALDYNPEKAKQLLKEYGQPVSFKYTVTATPRGRAFGQVFQEFWRNVGMNVELNQVDQTTLVTNAFTRNFDVIGWRIADTADLGPQMFANFTTNSPINLSGYSDPELDKMLEESRQTADERKRGDLYCKIAQRINDSVQWYWNLENLYHNIAKPGLKGVPKQRSDEIDLAAAWWEKKK
jgi:peptide/nickel transport system substrate-binding protein